MHTIILTGDGEASIQCLKTISSSYTLKPLSPTTGAVHIGEYRLTTTTSIRLLAIPKSTYEELGSGLMERALATITFVDGCQPSVDSGYFINELEEQAFRLGKPLIIAATRGQAPNALSSEAMREALGTSSYASVASCEMQQISTLYRLVANAIKLAPATAQRHAHLQQILNSLVNVSHYRLRGIALANHEGLTSALSFTKSSSHQRISGLSKALLDVYRQMGYACELGWASALILHADEGTLIVETLGDYLVTMLCDDDLGDIEALRRDLSAALQPQASEAQLHAA
ncbi:hypothetical protein [Herpetosiphon giganteus]|uniref:hypothetical protein n=1 Tax=Herpetosiphon giganteus TaxID=2029754 RepID=UPI001958BDA7|nr:hypothetical protein [Herpetosiphon giganteus]MBM7844867.1 signal recognition particle receptor subunit beta [Herpetosiphon giganteus]